MNSKQQELLISMIAGLQLSVAHLARVVVQNSNIAPEAMASSFDKTADAVAEGTVNREVIQMCVRQVSFFGGQRTHRVPRTENAELLERPESYEN